MPGVWIHSDPASLTPARRESYGHTGDSGIQGSRLDHYKDHSTAELSARQFPRFQVENRKLRPQNEVRAD
jgi:hypothetical protein